MGSRRQTARRRAVYFALRRDRNLPDGDALVGALAPESAAELLSSAATGVLKLLSARRGQRAWPGESVAGHFARLEFPEPFAAAFRRRLTEAAALSKLALTYYITARNQFPAVPGGGEKCLTHKVRAAFSAGIDYVQVREKDWSARRQAIVTGDLAQSAEKRSSRLLINDRLDIAASCGADGVHLPSDALPLRAVRQCAGSGFIVGISCHSASDVEKAAQDGASYVLFGPVFPTPSKPGAIPLGLAALEAVCRRFAVPVFALGGVDAKNAADCVRAGAAGLAGIRLFQDAPDLERLSAELHSLAA